MVIIKKKEDKKKELKVKNVEKGEETMERTDLINVLRERGYEAEEKDSIKNGVIYSGILIRKGSENVAPIIYTEQLLEQAKKEGKTIGEVVEEVLYLCEKGKKGMSFDVHQLFNKKWFLEHLSIGLQKKSEQELEKRIVEDMPEIEAYLYLNDTENGNNYEIKIGKQHLNMIGILEEDAWRKAYENLCKDTEIFSMIQMVSEITGQPAYEDMDTVGMHVISNKKRCKGASAILNHEAIKEFAKKQRVDRVFVLPSSVHEMLLIPDRGDFELENLSSMVTEINATQVDPEEQLANQAYAFEMKKTNLCYLTTGRRYRTCD